jgi:hypothetical protein
MITKIKYEIKTSKYIQLTNQNNQPTEKKTIIMNFVDYLCILVENALKILKYMRIINL